jgi:hypothetical protein
LLDDLLWRVRADRETELEAKLAAAVDELRALREGGRDD